MKPTFVTALLFWATLFCAQAQSGCPEKDPSDLTGRWSHPEREAIRERAMEVDAIERTEHSRILRGIPVVSEKEKCREPISIDKALTQCFASYNAPDTLAGKVTCFFEKMISMDRFDVADEIIYRGNLSPKTEKSLGIIVEGLRKEACEKEQAEQQQPNIFPDVFLDFRPTLSLGPKEYQLVRCSFPVVSTDGNPTDYRAANYNQANTQRLVDAIWILDPGANIHFNDPKIVGAQQDNEHAHDGSVQVTWSEAPLSPAGMKLLAESNPMAIRIALRVMQEKALGEYEQFDCTFALEYLKIAVPQELRTAINTLQEKRREQEREEDSLNWDLSTNKAASLDAATEAWREKRLALVQEDYNLSIQVLDCLKTADATMIQSAVKALQQKESEKYSLSWATEYLSRNKAADAATEMWQEKRRAVESERAELTLMIGYAKALNPVALMAALRVLEEKRRELNIVQH